MQLALSAACATVTMAAFAFITADAHGYISDPRVQFYDNKIGSNYIKTITSDVNTAFAGHKWDGSPAENLAMFNSLFPKTGYKSLRDMIDQQVPDCKNSRLDVPPVDVTGHTVMKWQNDQAHVGFVGSHFGPCHVYIDSILVKQSKNCVEAFGSRFPAEIDVDFYKCPGDCTLTFYWLALHEPKWQIYKQCVPISNKPGSQKQLPGTVKPADKNSYEGQNRALRTFEEAQAHLTNVANKTESGV